MTARMEHGNYGNGLVLGSWLLNAMYALDKGTVSFILSTICSVLAIIHYVIKFKQAKSKQDVGEDK